MEKPLIMPGGPAMDGYDEAFEKDLEEIERRKSRRSFYDFYPNKGPLRRELYPKHLEFFKAGATYRERCFMAANRVGKTVGGGGYEMTCHLSGDYPWWWEGRRWDRPVAAWAAGKTNETTRDIIQRKLLGKITGAGTSKKGVDGTGLIPGHLVGQPSWKQNVDNFVDIIPVKHISGGWSELGFKSYQQGSGSFEGTERDVIWLDEECDIDIYGECLVRTAGTTGAGSGGMIMLTFTPLLGLSEVVLSFMPEEDQPGYGEV
jgi:phage terminase large subunit-like protein